MLTYLVLFGDLISVPRIRLFGMAITAFRVGILLAFLISIAGSVRNQKLVISRRPAFLLLTLVFWIIWGAFSIVLSTYCDLKTGIKALVSLLYAFMLVCCYLHSEDEVTITHVLIAIRNAVVFLCLMGAFEIVSGFHLSISRLVGTADVNNAAIKLVKTNVHLASGTFYNENDYSAFLAIFLPTVFWFRKEKRAYHKLLSAGIVGGALLIMMLNDANIAAACALVGCGYYLAKNTKLTPPVFLLLLFFSGVILIGLAMVFQRMRMVLAAQIDNSRYGYGSLNARISIYRDSLMAVWRTHGLGIGAGAFSKYIMSTHPDSAVVNPHCWWLEILSCFGIPVFVMYCINFFGMLSSMLQKRKVCPPQTLDIVVACFLAFIIGCMVSSSFLGNAYQWLLFVMGFSFTGKAASSRHQTVTPL